MKSGQRGRRVPQQQRGAAFWSWFKANHDRIRQDIEGNKTGTYDCGGMLHDEVCTRLSPVLPGLSALMFWDGAGWNMAIRAFQSSSKKVFVENFIAEAPEIEGWRFSQSCLNCPDDYELLPEDLWFRISTHRNRPQLTLYVNTEGVGEEIAHEYALCLLNEIYESGWVMATFVRIGWGELPEDPRREGLLPLDDVMRFDNLERSLERWKKANEVKETAISEH